eukprot:PhM_4_TR9233/c0_g1_i1/m.72546
MIVSPTSASSVVGLGVYPPKSPPHLQFRRTNPSDVGRSEIGVRSSGSKFQRIHTSQSDGPKASSSPYRAAANVRTNPATTQTQLLVYTTLGSHRRRHVSVVGRDLDLERALLMHNQESAALQQQKKQSHRPSSSSVFQRLHDRGMAEKRSTHRVTMMESRLLEFKEQDDLQRQRVDLTFRPNTLYPSEHPSVSRQRIRALSQPQRDLSREKQEKAMRELVGCTFQPHIDENSNQMFSDCGGHRRVSATSASDRLYMDAVHRSRSAEMRNKNTHASMMRSHSDRTRRPYSPTGCLTTSPKTSSQEATKTIRRSPRRAFH